MNRYTLPLLLLTAAPLRAQRVVTPAPSPLKSFVIQSPAVLNRAVGSLDIPASAAAAIREAGSDLLNRGPVLLLALPQAETAAVLSKRWEGPAVELDWKGKGGLVKISRPNNVSAEADIAAAAFRLKNGEAAANDSWANRVLFNTLFDGAHGRNATDNPSIQGRYDVKDAVAWATSEGVTRAQGGGDELRGWDKKTGRLTRARFPTLVPGRKGTVHYFHAAPEPVLGGKVLAQMRTLNDESRFGLFDPKDGKLKVLKAKVGDIDVHGVLAHPDGKRLVFVRDSSTPVTPGTTYLGTVDLKTGRRREVAVKRELKWPALIELKKNGRQAVISAGEEKDLRWLTVDLKTGRIIKTEEN
jgi:hypothetical protein